VMLLRVHSALGKEYATPSNLSVGTGPQIHMPHWLD